MTVKTALQKRLTSKRTARSRAAEDAAWEAVRGLWKNKKIDAVKYQRRLREASDKRRGV